MNNSEAKKQLATKLAAELYNKDHSKFATLLNLTGIMQNNTKSDVAPTKTLDENTIGVWTYDAASDSFNRDAKLTADWPFWAQNTSIKKSSDNQRVLLIGESAARGMFYDPGFTPADVLQHLLDQLPSEQPIEVVDLAKTNATMQTLISVAGTAKQLQPDCVVVFAGNNWVGNRSYLGDQNQMFGISEMLLNGGVDQLRRALEQALLEQVADLVKQVNAPFKAANIPVYWIVPEFNLGDWRDPSLIAPWLAQPGDNKAWFELYTQASALFEQNKFDECIDLAEKMFLLDSGNCSATCYLLADCYAQQGKPELQSKYLELARDSSIIDSTRSYSPRITNGVRDQLLKSVQADGQQSIDMAALFADEGKVPGRSHFLDYCHLNSSAISQVMIEVVKQLAPNLSGTQSIGALTANSPSAEYEADAHLLAAIHNAHWGQNLDVVLHYCRQAINSSKHVIQIMRALVNIQTCRFPTWMNKEVDALLEYISPQVKRYLFSMEFKCLDSLLFEAFTLCCREYDQDISQDLLTVQLEQHAVERTKSCNLLDPYYSNTSFSNQQFMDVGLNNKNDFFKCYSARETFRFLSEASGPLKLHLTLRNNSVLEQSEKVTLVINKRRELTIEVANDWQSCQIEISQEDLSKGVNQVAILWSDTALNGEAPIAQLSEELYQNKMPELYPIFGHIYHFSVAV